MYFKITFTSEKDDSSNINALAWSRDLAAVSLVLCSKAGNVLSTADDVSPLEILMETNVNMLS